MKIITVRLHAEEQDPDKYVNLADQRQLEFPPDDN